MVLQTGQYAHRGKVDCVPLQNGRSVLCALRENAVSQGATAAFRHLPDVGIDAARDISWATLERCSQQISQQLLEAGLSRGDRVLLSFSPGLEFIAALLGCLHAGLIAVPVAPPKARDADRWCAIHRDAGGRMVLTDPALFGRLDTLCRDHDLGPCLEITLAEVPEVVSEGSSAPSSDDVAFLQYTSGSTGAPKGVIVTHGMLAANLEQIRAGFAYRAGDRILSWLPQSHDMGLMSSVFTPVWLGVEASFMSPAAFLRDPLRFLGDVGRLGATVIGGPNFAYQLCADRATPEAVQGVDLSTLRLAFNGAERIDAATIASFARVFAPCGFDPAAMVGCYGMAEATVCVTVAPAGAVRPVTGSIADSGVPVPGVDVAIIDPETRQRLSSDAVGEIWVRGANVSPGYWQNPDATADTFGHALDGGTGWMRSGDLGQFRDGRLHVTGRIKELIVIRGQNHHPQDIEASLVACHPAIESSRIAAFELGEGGLGIACEVTRQALRSVDTDEVVAAIRATVSENHGVAVARVTVLRPATLPMTPSGKIRRLACRDGAAQTLATWQADQAAATAPVADKGDLAARLRAMPPPLRRARLLAHIRDRLAAMLGHSGAIDDTRFFELGLDSASSVALVAVLERETGLQIEPAVIYEFPTPSALADHLLSRLFAAPVATTQHDDVTALRQLLAVGPGQ